MPTVTKTFYAPRGDHSLEGLNGFLDELLLPLEDFIDLSASRSRDGLWLTLTYREDLSLKLDTAVPAPGAWFAAGNLPTSAQMGFSAAVFEPIEDGEFFWYWGSGEESVNGSAITIAENGRLLTIPLPGLPGGYTGPLTLVGKDLHSSEGQKLDGPLSLSMTITGTTEKLPAQGNLPYSRDQALGHMQTARLTVGLGQQVDSLVREYLIHKGLEREQIIKILQVRSPNDTTDVFLLWWRGTAPKVISVAPTDQSTISKDTIPEQIFLEFDQPVPEHLLNGSDGEDRLFLDGVRYQDEGVTLVKIDDAGRQYLLKSIPWTSTSLGLHTMLVRPMPNQFGLVYSLPMLFSWQIQDVTASGGGGSGTWTCDQLPADDVETTFTLTNTPAGCPVHVYMNGLFQDPDCYTVIGDQIIFNAAPFGGLWVFYVVA